MTPHFTLETAAALSRSERSRITQDLLRQSAEARGRCERQALHDQVIILNVRVALAVAARYRGRGVALEDLEQAACEGLVKAVARYDSSLHHDLLTFAVPTIRGEVLRHFRDHAWSVRPPRRVQELQWRLRRSREQLAAELGREPTRSELCADLDVDEASYEEVLQAFGCLSPPSLDRPLSGDVPTTLGDLLPDSEDVHSPVEARVLLAPLLRRLAPPERQLLHLRFFEELSQTEIARRLGVPQSQVSRRLADLLGRMRGDIGALEAA